MTATPGLHTNFSEVMAGPCDLRGSGERRACRLELDVDVPEVLGPRADVRAGLRGRVVISGLADDRRATGDLHIAPLTRRRIRYRLDFTDLDGRRLHLDGWKSVSYLRPVRSMTTLPVTVTDESGAIVAEAVLRFHVGRHLGRMLRSLRLSRPANGQASPAAESDADADAESDGDGGAGRDLRPRWNGARGRFEVWYTTLTDGATGTGFWVHHELVAPDGGGPAELRGWAAVFPPGEPPRLAHFEPVGWHRPAAGRVLEAPGVTMSPRHLAGAAGRVEWDLRADPGREATLFTFPRWAWRTGLLPAAQVVPQPAARFRGTVRFDDRVLELDDARGATAHIYGQRHARRWAWLHADLGGGDVAEVVAAVPSTPVLRYLPPLPLVRLRVDGRELPAGDTLLAASRLHAEIGLPTWRVWGRVGDHRVRIEVTQDDAATVAVGHADPDGREATVRNSERADVHIRLDRRLGGAWRPYREWRLDGTGHAEVGDRG